MTNSQADRKIKKLLDDMARNGSTFTSTEDLMKTIGGIIDKYGESEDWEIGVADEATVCIPLSRYDELLRSESEIDILCTLYADEGGDSRHRKGVNPYENE